MRVEAEIRLSYQYNALTTMGMTGVIMLRYNYAVAQYNLIVVITDIRKASLQLACWPRN